jgi:hypothetical protein
MKKKSSSIHILDRLPVLYSPVMWKDDQIRDAAKRYELFEGDEERYRKTLKEAIKRNLLEVEENMTVEEFIEYIIKSNE